MGGGGAHGGDGGYGGGGGGGVGVGGGPLVGISALVSSSGHPAVQIPVFYCHLLQHVAGVAILIRRGIRIALLNLNFAWQHLLIVLQSSSPLISHP